MSHWLREPLLHFAAIGLMLFVADGFVNRGPGGVEPSRQIALTLDDLRQLDIYFESQWRRPPTAQEFSRLVEDKVQQEVLYREALAMGLDKEDTIVKRRMAQKLQFVAEDVATAHEPDAAELKAWYEKNRDRFALLGRITFRQRYFSRDSRGDQARADAERTLAKLAGEPVNSPVAASLGDQFMLQEYYADRTSEQLGKDFGPAFAQAVFQSKPGSWQGPIESGFGWHLVFVDSFVPGRSPAFEEVEPDVKTAWLGEQKAEAWRRAYDAMRGKYTVMLPAPPPDASATASASPTVKAMPIPLGVGGL